MNVLTMSVLSDVLEHLYQKVLYGAVLENDSSDCASYLTPLVSSEGCLAVPSGCDPHGQDPAEPEPPAASVTSRGPSLKASAHDQVLLQLTVIRVMATRVSSPETKPGCKEKYREILNILLKSSEVDLKLTSLFGSRDKLLSHLAAQVLGLLLYFQLREKVPLRDSCIAFCRTSLGDSLGSGQVTCCLWVLSAVIKEVLKGPDTQKTESLQQFLSPLDATLEDFYDSFFSQCLRDPSGGIDTLLAFLDLLELLAASRPYLVLPRPCQRLLFRKPARVLDVVTQPVPAFVRRKCILVLKKCLLGKVGEDLSGHPLSAIQPPDPHLDADTAALAGMILQAMDSGLLRTLPVPGQAPHFGGEGVQPGAAQGPGADQVMLRAVSLLVIKSLEVTFQRRAAASEVKGDLQRFMSELLNFLNPHLQPAVLRDHPCAWLSRVFIEQDDDMLEAAKTSLDIYLQLTRASNASGKDRHGGTAVWASDAHSSGCDPHCIFLSVLGSVGFDSTTLLDFLISSETCFLEYFVRLLRLLQSDWAHFVSVCAYWDGMKSEVGVSDDEHGPSLARERCRPVDPGPGTSGSSQGDEEGASHAPLSHDQQAQAPSSSAPSLVAYDSSDDSEEEVPGQSFSDAEPPVTPETVETVQMGQGAEGRVQETHSRPVAPKDPAGHLPAACDAVTGSSSGQGLCCRTVSCLGSLRRAITRLQRRGLFPYNPAALLKLLRRIDAVSRQGGAYCEGCLSPEGGLSPAAARP